MRGLVDKLKTDHQQPHGEREAQLAVGDARGNAAAGNGTNAPPIASFHNSDAS